jgi:xylulokinase
MDVVLGADLGTSGLKVAVLDPAGVVVAEAEVGYAPDTPQPGWAQTEVAVWRSALAEALDRLDLTGHTVRALGLAGQMHGAVLVDAAGRALAPALLWPDQRAGTQLGRWRALPDDARAALANPLVPGMTGPLTAWLAEHEPELVARAAGVLLPKDALRAGLVPGVDPLVTDRSDASATLLWDVPADTWSAAAVALVGVAVPRVLPAHHVVGTAALPGLGAVPVVVGGADTPLALLATGTTSGLQVNLGTGAQLLRPGAAPAPALDPVVHTCADAAEGWYAMAALQNAGLAWDWVRSVLGFGWAELLATLEGPGARGVRFAPWLTGERGGVAGPDDRGAWTGLHPGTTRADLGRAALEGVATAVAAAAELLGPAGEDPVVLTGGGARTPAVQQLLADALGRPVQHVQVRSASAAGAAQLAARGVGLDLAPQRRLGPVVDPAHPGRG